ncbi:MAG: helix-turn-helix transcriptional regulator [Clostridia bacterium]|nr:helix-turn-helix transcriptional regulator [Clostridia bacterium]
MDVLARVRQLMKARNWSYYKMAKECGIPEATAYNMENRNTVPSMPTLELICNGMGITLAQFFAEGEMVELTPELKELFDVWVDLSPRSKKALLEMVNSIKAEQ